MKMNLRPAFFTFCVYSESSIKVIEKIYSELRLLYKENMPPYKTIICDDHLCEIDCNQFNSDELVIIFDASIQLNELISNLISKNIPVICNKENSNSSFVEEWKTGFKFSDYSALCFRLEHFIRQPYLFSILSSSKNNALYNERTRAFNSFMNNEYIKTSIKSMGFDGVENIEIQENSAASSVIVFFDCDGVEYVAKFFQTRINNYKYWFENQMPLLLDKEERFLSELRLSNLIGIPPIYAYNNDANVIVRKRYKPKQVSEVKYIETVISAIDQFYKLNEITDEKLLSAFLKLNLAIKDEVSLNDIEKLYKKTVDKYQLQLHDYSLRVEIRYWKNALLHLKSFLSQDTCDKLYNLEQIINNASFLEENARVVFLHGGIVHKNIVYGDELYLLDAEKVHIGWEGYDVASFLFSIKDLIVARKYNTSPLCIVKKYFNVDLVMAWLALICYEDIIKHIFSCGDDLYARNILSVFEKIHSLIRA